LPVLDEELSRLPDKYRSPIVLCDLEGRTRKEVSRQLKIPEGTLSSRLTTARRMLARRLARRGIEASVVTSAAVFFQNAASAGVPLALLNSSVKAAMLVAARIPLEGDMISAKVAALAEGVLKTMLLKKLKVVALVLVIAAILGGAGLFYHTQPAAPAQDKAIGGRPAQSDKETSPAGKVAEADASPASAISRLSSGPMPRQALVALDKGQVVVRTLDVMVEPITVHFQGKTQTSYQKAETLRTKRFDLEMVKIYDVKGKGIDKKELPELLKNEIVALISTDAQAADPLNLRLFKEGTLLFILPSPSGAPGHIYTPSTSAPIGPGGAGIGFPPPLAPDVVPTAPSLPRPK
jgi:hypothetical protein